VRTDNEKQIMKVKNCCKYRI